MILREYQNDAVRMLRQALLTGSKRPILKLATGSGKTLIVAEIVKLAREKNKSICFFVDQITLIDQASKTFDKLGIDHGIIQADNPRQNLNKPVQIASVQTYFRRKPWPADIFLVDECHVTYKGLIELMNKWNNVPFIGVTATPYTKGLGNIYDKLICPIEIQELIDQGYLVDADIYGPSEPDMTRVSTSGDDYNQGQAAEAAMKPKIIASIIDTWYKLAEGKQTLCFATNILHSKYLTEEFCLTGADCHHIDAYSDSKECYETIEAFKNKEIMILSSVAKLIKGFDSPSAEVGIMARPTKSLSLWVQCLGRLLRPYPGKEKALVLDHSGNTARLGFHTDSMPNVLDVTVKGERKKSEELEPLPKPCPKCHFLKPVGSTACPKCGFETKSQNKIFEEQGELKKMKKEQKMYTMEQKQEFYSGLLFYAMDKGYNLGWAANKYREKFSVWPNQLNKKAQEPCESVLKFIQHCNIKYHKSKEKA